VSYHFTRPVGTPAPSSLFESIYRTKASHVAHEAQIESGPAT
jgi:hypothetical protein